jgi:hypothetical protein
MESGLAVDVRGCSRASVYTRLTIAKPSRATKPADAPADGPV